MFYREREKETGKRRGKCKSRWYTLTITNIVIKAPDVVGLQNSQGARLPSFLLRN